MDNRVEIVQKFASVAEHPDQCYDFDIQNNLDAFFKYQHHDINFSEAAFLIYDAARIYGRKVDYLEQILLDFNQRSATNVSKALAEVRAMAENADKNTAKNGKKPDEQEKRLREKERVLKRAKRMLKAMNKIEFKPKPFEIVTIDQISLNLHDQRSELEMEEEFDRLRMKNVFPRINVLQSNLQSNNAFYDNLGIDESDIDNLDSLRDFRIFMDTVDEPIFMRPITDKEVDPRYEEELKRSIERANQKHTNIYLPADYIKETYGITLKDNSDYLNMLKYNKEYERLNLRKMTIEQLSKLKIGTYLNNILHGKEQDGNIPEHDSGIEVDDMDRDFESSMTKLPDSNIPMETDIIGELSSSKDDSDVSMTDLRADNTTTIEEDTLNITAILPLDESLNDIESSAENEELNSSEQSDQTMNTQSDSMFETSTDEVNSSLETSKEADRTNELRQSLDDGICVSECNSPSRLSEEFEGFMSTDLVDSSGLIDLNGVLNAVAGNHTPKVPTLESNVFELPEKLLRRQKIFALTDEFELWMAARKRKFGSKPDPPNCGKLLKLSNGVLIRSDPDSDGEEFLGFDENHTLYTAPSMVVEEQPNPATINNRTCSSDSGISPERLLNGNGGDESQTILNGSEVNDSGVAELESTVEATLNVSADSTLNTTTDNGNGGESSEKIIQATDLSISSISDANANANSTKLFNETASYVTGFDSGFSELESQLESTADLSNTDNVLTAADSLHENEGSAQDLLKVQEDIVGDFIDEAIDCEDNRNDNEKDQLEDAARAEGFSDMVERVSKWHQMLRPVLADCEKRNNFDIHALGTDIIDLFPQDEEERQYPTEISFTDVMEGRDETYTARYFLSMLLLTNNKNVHLKVMHPENNGKVLCSKDDIRIKLQSRTRHLDEVNKIDQHLIETQSSHCTDNTLNMNEANGSVNTASTKTVFRTKKTAQKRKRNSLNDAID